MCEHPIFSSDVKTLLTIEAEKMVFGLARSLIGRIVGDDQWVRVSGGG
jgi:hypothetical protein